MADLLRPVWIHGRPEPTRFACPVDGEGTDARRSTVRRWLAVLGRPILPLGPTRDLIACGRCGHVYDAAIESQRPADAADAGASTPRAEDELAIEALAAAAVYSDSIVRPSEKEAVRTVIRRYTGKDLRQGELDGFLRYARRHLGDPLDRLEMLAHALDDRAKRRILAAVYMVSAGDREVHAQESRFLMRIGDALRMGPQEVREALRQARAR